MIEKYGGDRSGRILAGAMLNLVNRIPLNVVSVLSLIKQRHITKNMIRNRMKLTDVFFSEKAHSTERKLTRIYLDFIHLKIKHR